MTQVQSAKPWQSNDKTKLRIYIVMSDGREGFYDLKSKTANGNVTIEECKTAYAHSKATAKTANGLGTYYAKPVATPAQQRANAKRLDSSNWRNEGEAHDAIFGDN
jgi:hypothetical protein